MNVFFVNFITFLITSLFFYHKFKRLNFYVFLWIANTFSAFMSYYCVSQGYYYNTDVNLGYKLSITPYIANYLFTFIALYPFYNFNEKKICWAQSEINPQYSKFFINISLFIFVINAIFNLANVFIASQVGFHEIYESRHVEGVNLLAFSNPLLSGIYNWTSTYYQVARTIVIVLLISKLIHIKWKSKKYFFQLLMCFIPSLFAAIAGANRGGLFFLFADFIFIYLLTISLIPPKIKKVLISTIFIILGFMAFYAIQISISRFVENGNEDSLSATIRYFGEGMANLGDLYYGKVRHHPMGEMFFPEFFDVPDFNSMSDFFYYWSKNTGVPIQLFGTLFGDCYIQFGLIGAFIFIFILATVWRLLFFKYSVTYIPFVMYYFLKFGVAGLFGYGFYDKRVHVLFISLMFIAFLIRKKNNKSQTKRR